MLRRLHRVLRAIDFSLLRRLGAPRPSGLLPARPRQSPSSPWRYWRPERDRPSPTKTVRRRSIGASGNRCRCKRAAARSRWIRWLARHSARSATSRASPTRRPSKNSIPRRSISRCFSPGKAGIRPASPHGMPKIAGCPGQPAKHQPDAWDREPLLLVDSAALRTALGLPRRPEVHLRPRSGPGDDRGSEDRRKEPFPGLGANAPSRRAATTRCAAKEGNGAGGAILDVPERPSRAETRNPAGS